MADESYVSSFLRGCIVLKVMTRNDVDFGRVGWVFSELGTGLSPS